MSSGERHILVAKLFGYGLNLGYGSTNGVHDLILDGLAVFAWDGKEYNLERKLVNPEIDPKFASNSGLGWADVRNIASNPITHPTKILKISALNQQFRNLLGANADNFYFLFSNGVGSVSAIGDTVIGTICLAHK